MTPQVLRAVQPKGTDPTSLVAITIYHTDSCCYMVTALLLLFI